MLLPVPRMSNTERQRKFRKRHPGYFKKYNGRKKASRLAAQAQLKADARAQAEQAAAEAAAAVTHEPAALPLTLPAPRTDGTPLGDAPPQAVTVTLANPTPKVRLALPAPSTHPRSPRNSLKNCLKTQIHEIGTEIAGEEGRHVPFRGATMTVGRPTTSFGRLMPTVEAPTMSFGRPKMDVEAPKTTFGRPMMTFEA